MILALYCKKYVVYFSLTLENEIVLTSTNLMEGFNKQMRYINVIKINRNFYLFIKQNY